MQWGAQNMIWLLRRFWCYRTAMGEWLRGKTLATFKYDVYYCSSNPLIRQSRLVIGPAHAPALKAYTIPRNKNFLRLPGCLFWYYPALRIRVSQFTPTPLTFVDTEFFECPWKTRTMACTIIWARRWCRSLSWCKAPGIWDIVQITHWSRGGDWLRWRPPCTHRQKNGQVMKENIFSLHVGKKYDLENKTITDKPDKVRIKIGKGACLYGTAGGRSNDKMQGCFRKVQLRADERRVFPWAYENSRNAFVIVLHQLQWNSSPNFEYWRLRTQSGGGIAQRAHASFRALSSNFGTSRWATYAQSYSRKDLLNGHGKWNLSEGEELCDICTQIYIVPTAVKNIRNTSVTIVLDPKSKLPRAVPTLKITLAHVNNFFLDH